MTWQFESEAMVLKILGEHFDFPNTYVVLDTETTGFSFDKDFIIDVGWAVVRDRKIVDQQNLLLDWSQMPVDHSLIQSKLRYQAEQYAEQGKPHYYPWERLCDEGEHPLQVLHAYSQLIYEHIQNPDSIIVGQGFWRFDRKMIDSHTRRFLQGYLLPWRLNSIMDTGALEKAAQMNRPPYEHETLDEWIHRTIYARAKGVKFNMDPHCVGKYRLNERYNVDMALMHTAGFDCVLIHYLLETYRELIEILDGQRHTLTGNEPIQGQNPLQGLQG